ncbi:PTS lactose/cellobiose transporter subunit IIA, partial [Bacillus cereus]
HLILHGGNARSCSMEAIDCAKRGEFTEAEAKLQEALEELKEALIGAMFMASSVDFVTLFVGLELLSLSSYILVGIRKKNRASNEAA